MRKYRIPVDRTDITIKKSYLVLEVGPGHNPSKRSDVLVEKYINNNEHRCGDVKVYQHQKLLNYDGDNMPFNNKHFDYVICNQVLEHTDNPSDFCKELSRVSKRGYLECPSFLGEFLFPKESHAWVIMEEQGVLYAMKKNHNLYKQDFGNFFLNIYPYKSLLWRLLQMSVQNLCFVRIEWNENIVCRIVETSKDEGFHLFDTKNIQEFIHKPSINKICKSLLVLIRVQLRKLI